jgi:hypothetical protein
VGAPVLPDSESPHAVIEPSALRAAKAFILRVLLLPLKPMAQSRRGVAQIGEVRVHLLAVAMPKFIQLGVPLPLLKLTAQSRRGVAHMLEAQVHPLAVAIPRFIGITTASGCTCTSKI